MPSETHVIKWFIFKGSKHNFHIIKLNSKVFISKVQNRKFITEVVITKETLRIRSEYPYLKSKADRDQRKIHEGKSSLLL